MDTADIKWLHLSDFHIGKDDYATRNIIEYILDEIKSECTKSRKPDFIFITGDLANKGRYEEYAEFDKEFIVPLLELLGDSHIPRIFIIPGNHDVDRTQAKSVMGIEVLTKVDNFLDPSVEGQTEREFMLKRFRYFDEHEWFLENVRWVSSAQGYLAKKVEAGGCIVGVLCVNTAWFCKGDEDQYKLTPGRGMVEQGLRELAGCSPIFVLGHHPIEWLAASDAKQIRAMLSKAGAIYLHGHLHKTEHLTVSSGATPLVSLQAGCAFFARDDDKWLTRLLWGGYEAASSALYVRPKKWVPDHQEWALDTEAYPNSLRVEGRDYWTIPTQFAGAARDKSIKGLTKVEIIPPDGWVIVDFDFLENRRGPVSEDRLLQYFEGRVPQWDDILSGGIPARGIVYDILNILTQGIEGNEPTMTLLLGAGGEGKSTAFLQILERLAREQSVKVLWRSNPERGLPYQFVTSLAATKNVWLIATDEADSLVEDTYHSIRALPDRSKVHFILACRDTDWIENGGNDRLWNQIVKFSERRMKGLDAHDAQKIVDAWTKLGPRGLGKLTGLESEEAVNRLLDAARLEATTSDGSFLGAMLRVRVGMALKDHVAALMSRLERCEILGLPGKSLLEAFAFIFVPHAYNLLFLSKSVFAKALGMEEGKVRRRILGPLGEEAAAGSVGHFILTRHRAIAEAALEIGSNRFNFDPEEILSDLVRAALLAGNEGSLVPHLKDWRYLSARMFDLGNESLGVKLAIAALSVDPKNSFLAVKLANLYREAGQPEESVKVFRKSFSQDQGNRAFFTEWGTGEGFIGNSAVSIWLKAVSLADGVERRPPDGRDVAFGLSGCLVSFITLFERYQDPIYLAAASASNYLGRLITLPMATFEIFETGFTKLMELGAEHDLIPTKAMERFVAGVGNAYEQREIEFPSPIPIASTLRFSGLEKILKIRR